MARVQIGKKQRVETLDYDEATKAIARKVVREIVEEGFNGADVLPGVWVIEKTIRNSIVNEQPNISPDISSGEVNELAKTVLASVKTKTDMADEKLKSIETYESQLNFPKELPTIKMGNITVVKFPEGGADSARSIKVDGYKKVGKFYRKKLDVEMLGKRKGRTRKELDIIRKEKQQNLRRVRIRRGLLKPVSPTKSFNGVSPIGFGRPTFTMPKPINMGMANQIRRDMRNPFVGQGTAFGGRIPFNKVNVNDPNLSPFVISEIKKIKDGVKRDVKGMINRPSIANQMDVVRQNASTTVGGLAVPSGPPSDTYRIG